MQESHAIIIDRWMPLSNQVDGAKFLLNLNPQPSDDCICTPRLIPVYGMFVETSCSIENALVEQTSPC